MRSDLCVIGVIGGTRKDLILGSEVVENGVSVGVLCGIGP